MKTAISIPDDLFDGAERLARRTRRSRSRLFTDAVREYLARHAPDKVTESMDQAIMEIGQGNDEFVYSVARRTLEQTEWWSLKARFGGRSCQLLPAPGLGFGDLWSLFRAMPWTKAA
jgi:predicted transcriptional regulator